MTLRTVITILFRFTLFYFFFMISLELLFYFVLKKKKDKSNNQITGYRINVFGLLMELDNFTMLALSVALIRFLFLLWTLFDSAPISYIHITMLCAFSLLFGIFSKSIKNFIFEIINCGALYFALISSRLLTNYLVEIRYEWYVFAADIMLKLFIIIYATFFLLRNINNSIVKTKYIRRERNDEEDA